jgi:hypothetical protein
MLANHKLMACWPMPASATGSQVPASHANDVVIQSCCLCNIGVSCLLSLLTHGWPIS